MKACLRASEEAGRDLVIDMICVDDLPTRIRELEAAGVKHLAVHTGADQQAAGRQPIEDLKVMKQHVSHSRISVAGGLTAIPSGSTLLLIQM